MRGVGQVEDANPLEAHERSLPHGAAGRRVACTVLAADQLAVPLERIDRLEEQQPPVVLPERDVVLRSAAEVADDELVRVRVEDAEPVVASGDGDVAQNARSEWVRPEKKSLRLYSSVMFGLWSSARPAAGSSRATAHTRTRR
jgi:hypothetical protein